MTAVQKAQKKLAIILVTSVLPLYVCMYVKQCIEIIL